MLLLGLGTSSAAKQVKRIGDQLERIGDELERLNDNIEDGDP